MFFRILRKSFSKRKSRAAIAIISVIIGAAIATSLISVSNDISENVGNEFRKYGANLLVVPKTDTIEVGFPGVDFGSVTNQRYINESDLWKIRGIFWRLNVLGFAPLLYQVVQIDNNMDSQNVVLVGTYFDHEVQIIQPFAPEDPAVFTTGIQAISPWWKITGDWISDPLDIHSSMVGMNVADKLGLSLGDIYTVNYIRDYEQPNQFTSYDLKIVGIIETDGHEDNQIFVNLQVAQNISGRMGLVHTVQVSALCNECPVEAFATQIEGSIPYIEARTVKQLVSAEMNILSKIENMMFLITIVALFASALGVLTTMTSSVIERQKEIGLMKSVGADNRQIVSLFFSEATIIALVGAILGYLIGIVLAQFVGISVFNTTISPRVEIIPIVIAISLGVVILASILPVRRAVRIEPAIVLRGE
jgi:putative ABC transport system permease protein